MSDTKEGSISRAILQVESIDFGNLTGYGNWNKRKKYQALRGS